ncbi:uncharacterized protein LOC123667258 [Melitaea cinxia]|uniref:uncharacterized protein LOC123667258 n=1 Tax=Melitaea cinxia TaxID=113334 RepID=UPI001E274878|nr:uncharacterized protein LOC123667258 [Melitaea cinxia]
MSDYEEPSAKVSKVEEAPKDRDEEMDEGQEEWLSEGILTDDDYNPTAEDSHVNTSQDNTMTSVSETVNATHDATDNSTQETGNKSENTQRKLDNTDNADQTEFPGELGAFLIRKTDGRVIEKKAESDLDDSKHSGDDGHDTDELLRMLGGDESKEIEKVDQKGQESSDDDEYMFEGAKIARLKVAKNVMMKKYPRRAEPESDGDTDEKISPTEGAVQVQL